jgi:hypothetical protein
MQREDFFFEKKKQKTFAAAPVLRRVLTLQRLCCHRLQRLCCHRLSSAGESGGGGFAPPSLTFCGLVLCS